MSDIQTAQNNVHHYDNINGSARNLNSSQDTISVAVDNTLYTYIGISEPDKTHLYENRTVIEAQKRASDFDADQHERM